MNGADTAWLLTATALVLFMTLPGLALFYAGLVRARNALSVFMQCFSIAACTSIAWFAIGYSIAFGDGHLLQAAWGGVDKIFMRGIDIDTLAGTIPETLFFAFQMTFAIITPALIVGAYVERIRFDFMILFSVLWVLICYAPVAHWVWGGGWLAQLGVLDFAGGLVVHETAGIAALVIACALGPRRGFPTELKPPHSPGMVMIGAAMLWVGWFGFNAGSALAADGSASMALVVTHIAAAAASISWALTDRVRFGKSSLVGIVTGMVAGLATVTPASGFIGPVGALLIGSIAGVACQYMCGVIKNRFRIDDTLDVFAVHGFGGVLGTLSLPILSQVSLGGGGLGNVTLVQQLLSQVTGVAAICVYTLATTWVIIKLVGLITAIRIDPETEFNGLDLEEHGEKAYDLNS